MFPLNQDTFIEYSGNTANDLYSDGYGYIYMMKEGRGRSDSGGNFLISKTIDNWYFEVNTLMENGSTLYTEKQYHGMDLTNDKNVAYIASGDSGKADASRRRWRWKVTSSTTPMAIMRMGSGSISPIVQAMVLL